MSNLKHAVDPENFMDFEQIYLDNVDPFEQSGTTGEIASYYAYSRIKLVRRLAERFNSKACGLEVGCGYGYLTDMLAQKFHMSGVDVSPTAIKRAQHLHPGIEFEFGDIVSSDYFSGTYHFVVLPQVWLYLELYSERVITNCTRMLEPNGVLVISQGFEAHEDFEKTLNLFLGRPYLRLIETLYDDTGMRCLNDGLIMLRKVEHADDDEGTLRRLRVPLRG